MITPEALADRFALNLRIMQRQTAGLSHADSLLQPPFRGNCMNWVLGHLYVNRMTLLKMLGVSTEVDEALKSRYGTGSSPVTHEEPGVLPLETLLETMAASQSLLERALLSQSTAAFLEPLGEQGTLGEVLFGLYFHEVYHTGQLEYLRQLAGMDDAVI